MLRRIEKNRIQWMVYTDLITECNGLFDETRVRATYSTGTRSTYSTVHTYLPNEHLYQNGVSAVDCATLHPPCSSSSLWGPALNAVRL